MSNIQTRLKRLERTAVDDRLCSCKRGADNIVICNTMETPEEEIADQIAEAQKPKYCETCGKQTEQMLIIIEGVEPNSPPIDALRSGEDI